MSPRSLTWLLPLPVLLAACATNRLDRQGDRTGRWRTFYDEAGQQRQSVGRYRHHQSVGRWRFYAPDGRLDRRERFLADGYSRLTYYHPNGRVWRQGRTRIADTGHSLRYYWTGDWLIFGETGALQQVDTYELGRRVTTRTGLHQPPVPVRDSTYAR